MLFNSFVFLIFLTLVFAIYWSLNRNLLVQNFFLLVVSYIFYSWWDYRFTFLLIFSTFLDYFTGLKIHQSGNDRWRKIWLFISVAVNLGFLWFFKYYNFFIESFVSLFETIGLQPNIWTLRIILPVGISFYTFHGLSYVFDIYNRKVVPTRNYIDYAVFVSFFPLLVAGPIERATHLLPQVQTRRSFGYNKAVDGLVCIFWGLFKKIVIADNCAIVVNAIFTDYETASSVELIAGAVLFAFQIYGDFSGYSDMAIGAAKLLGFDLMINFRVPYFSRSIAEFWRRWHISLSSWFRDYLYIPIGGSKGSRYVAVRNTIVVFLVSGLWHGANWTFVFWGSLNALYFLPLLLSNRNRENLDTVAEGRSYPTFKELFQILLTFSLTCFAWIFFRSETITDAFRYIKGIFTSSHPFKGLPLMPEGMLLLPVFIWVEWVYRRNVHPLQDARVPHKWAFVFVMIMVTTAFRYIGRSIEFIYFQF